MTSKHDDDLLEKIRRAVKFRNDAMTTFEASKETLTSRTKEVGLLLLEARKGKTVKEWDAFLKKAELFSLSWAYEAMNLAGGRKTVEQSRADAAERQRESRERKKQREIEAAAAKALPKPEPEPKKDSVTVTETADDGVEAMKAKMAALDAGTDNDSEPTNKTEPELATDNPPDDPLVTETRKGGYEGIEASPWFAAKIKPIFEGTVKNDPAKSAKALAQFKCACATLLPQMTVNDLQAAQDILSVVGDAGADAIDDAAKAKRIKAEAKNPEKTKDKARKAAQAFYMEYDMEEAKAESRESGEPWSEQKEEWIEEWIANNWDAEREAKFSEEFQLQWKRDHGTEFTNAVNAEQKEAA